MRPTTSWFVFAALCCALFACTGPEARLALTTDPHARIELRQQFMAEAAPDVPIVQEQTKRTIADVAEARAGVADLQVQVDQLKGELVDARSDERKAIAAVQVQHARWVMRLRVGCIFLIPLGIAAAVYAPPGLARKLVFVPIAAVITLIAIAIDGFTWKYGMPIAAAAIGAIVLMLLVCIGLYLRANRELITSGGLLINKIVGGSKAVKPTLDLVQSPTTKALIDRQQAREAARVSRVLRRSAFQTGPRGNGSGNR